MHKYKTNSIPSLTKLDLFFSQLQKMIQLILTKQLPRVPTHLATTQDPPAETYGKDCDLLKNVADSFQVPKKTRETLELRSWSQCMDVLDVVWVIVCIETSHFSLSTYTREGPSWWKWWIFPT